jgi:hypothetical protein
MPVKTTAPTAELKAIDPAGNGAAEDIRAGAPYVASVTLEGVTALLFHAWDNEAVEEKAKAPKNSRAKKTDNIESYVYRLPSGNLALPGEMLRQSLVSKREGAARYRPDPRSPRKSACDLYAAGISALTEFADLGIASWDYVDRRRVRVNQAAITRERPAIRAGWHATIDLMVRIPEYLDPPSLLALINEAGKLVGLADHRPSYGRFAVVRFEVGLVE